jgi:hypothetical protein
MVCDVFTINESDFWKVVPPSELYVYGAVPPIAAIVTTASSGVFAAEQPKGLTEALAFNTAGCVISTGIAAVIVQPLASFTTML